MPEVQRFVEDRSRLIRGSGFGVFLALGMVAHGWFTGAPNESLLGAVCAVLAGVMMAYFTWAPRREVVVEPSHITVDGERFSWAQIQVGTVQGQGNGRQLLVQSPAVEWVLLARDFGADFDAVVAAIEQNAPDEK